jgi:hypothetical protein
MPDLIGLLMRQALMSLTVLTCATLAAACSGDPVAGQPSVVSTEQSSSVPADPPTSERATVELGGDAATNKGCKLVTVAEVERVTGYTVWKVDGLPAGFRGDIGCVWRLVAVDYGAPALTVTWDRNDTDAAGKAALLRQLIRTKQRSEIPGVGDVATQDGSSIDVLTGRQWLYLTLRLHQIATPDDQRMNRELLKIMYPRSQHKPPA